MENKQPHIRLNGEAGIKKAVLVGDPARLDILKTLLHGSQELAYNREFRSIAGHYRDEPILGISTGIGAPSAAIAVEELKQIGIETAIRVGSAGAYQQHIGLGELIIAQACVRDDGLTCRYAPANLPALPDLDLLMKAKALAPKAHFGIIRSHDGFYMDDNCATETFWSDYGVLGADMESGALMLIGRIRGMKTLSILNNVVLWKQDVKEGISDLVHGESKVTRGEKESLTLALDILTA